MQESLGRRAVELVPLGLVEGPLVVVEAQPRHRGEDLRRQLFARALDVRVLDAQDERAAGVAGKEQVVEGCPGAADVE